MSTANKQIISNMIENIPDNKLSEVIQFLFFIKKKVESDEFLDLQEASKSSMDFWDNTIDDEVWNNV